MSGDADTGDAVTGNAAPGHPPDATLRAYALGDLSGPAESEVEAHLEGCGVCRASVRATRDELVRLTETLPLLEPEAANWAHVRRRVRPAPPRPWLAAAAVVLLAVGGWGLWQQRVISAQTHDQRVVAGWLARPDLTLLTLRDKHRAPSGRVMLAADHTALFVLPPAPAGQTYHAWVGLRRGWKFGDPLRLVQTSRDGVFKVSVEGSDYLCVSLEAAPTPPRPSRVLGWTFL